MIYARPLDRLADWCLPERMRRGRPFWALREITLSVPRGSSMGVIGVNGAGKSTLLKILTGTTAPTAGSCRVEGRISSLLELGTGFHPEFTGRQNIQFGGKMSGLSEAEVEEKLPAIIEFAELGDFIDQPVRTYSSGMALRLGFALAASVDPEVLIIDEALSVGDLHFQQKCLRRMNEFHERGVTVLFVSHDPSLVVKFCTEAILLDEGRMLDRGKPDAVIDYYTALLAEKYREGGRRTRIVRPQPIADSSISDFGFPISDLKKTEGVDELDGVDSVDIHQQSAIRNPQSAIPNPQSSAPLLGRTGYRTGNFRAVITGVWLDSTGVHGNPNLITSGRPATLHVRFVTLEAIERITVGIMIRDRLGQEVFGLNTQYREREIGPLAAGGATQVGFGMPMNLGPGLYSITAAVHAGTTHTEFCYDWIEQAAVFQVLPDPTEPFTGICRLEAELSIEAATPGAEELEYARGIMEAKG